MKVEDCLRVCSSLYKHLSSCWLQTRPKLVLNLS